MTPSQLEALGLTKIPGAAQGSDSGPPRNTEEPQVANKDPQKQKQQTYIIRPEELPE